MNSAPLSLALLNHLGISLHDALEAGPWGDPEEWLHVFAPASLVDQVSCFFMDAGKEFRARVYEGSPPPFYERASRNAW